MKKITPSKNKLKAIDLFAGIGGFRIGFSKENCEFIFSSETDKFARQSYEANFGEIPSGDITKIDEKDIPVFDILLAGFPCQPFSNAGKQKGFTDIRGTLFFDIVRIIKYHEPKAVLLENVPRFKTHDNGKTLKTATNKLKHLGYKVYVDVLNAKDFGLPQNRERIFIVAFREKIDFIFPTSKKSKTQVGDILEKNTLPKYTISDNLWSGHRNRKQKNQKEGKGFGFSSCNKKSTYTRAITARYYKDAAEILIEQSNANPRMLTPREAARLQGFPESFKIVCSDMQSYKQFGNSVAVPVIKALANAICKKI